MIQHYIQLRFLKWHPYFSWQTITVMLVGCFLYSLDLANLETSQLDPQKILTEGGFNVNRTGKSVIKVTVNPVSKRLSKYFFFNIKTGTQVSKDVEEYLLTLFRWGEEKRMYLYVNVAAHLNDLLNQFTRQPLLPLLARILKEKINQKK